MPTRSNYFQDVVALVQRALAPHAHVTESAMLFSRDTGAEREVDVLVTGTLWSYQVVIGVEARGRKRPATIEWVEQQICKHADLPTDLLVLVSESGFTTSALAKARAHRVRALWPTALPNSEPGSEPGSDLEARFVSLTRLGVAGEVHTPLGQELWPNVEGLLVFDSDGTQLTQVADLVEVFLSQMLASPQHDSTLWLTAADDGHPAGFRSLTVDITALLIGGVHRPVYLRHVTDDGASARLDQLLTLHVEVHGVVVSTQVRLQQWLLNSAVISSTPLPNPPQGGTAALVRVEPADGLPPVTVVRLRGSDGSDPRDFPLQSS